MDNPLTFLFIGRSGCGKGTQVELLRKYFEDKDGRDSVVYVYAGQRMRDLIEKSDSFTSKLANKIMMTGGKQPDFFAIWAWSNELIDKLKENTHLIIDGSPRTLLEARVLDEAFDFYKRKEIRPILLDVSYDWAAQRLKERGRFDDTEERIKKRFEYFDKYVVPAIEYYEKESKNRLIRVNGEQSIKKVHKDIMETLNL
jgi:adenylate kinase family enzyme